MKFLTAFAVVLIAALIVVSLNPPEQNPAPPAPLPAPPPRTLSALGAAPDWSQLDPYQLSITRAEFERQLEVFASDHAWQPWITVDDTKASIRTGPQEPPAVITFAPATAQTAPLIRPWRSAAQMPPAAPERILEGVHIAIDPGHIGGQWAQMEERWMQVGDAKPVCEGDMTLLVAQLLKPELEALGAKVTLVRQQCEPVTPLRPADLLAAAQQEAPAADQATLQRTAERLFYRTAEIHARARLVNETIRPDLVLCLHFDADQWKDPHNPTLIETSHFHMLVNGCYTADELALDDQRFEMLHKLLQRTHDTEAGLSRDIASAFVAASKLPAYTYPATSSARQIDGNPYIWARNLIANRLYHCPVTYLEPYVMNCRPDCLRMQAGDFDGTRIIDGKEQVSIFREYAFAVRDGLKNHYLQHRASITK